MREQNSHGRYKHNHCTGRGSVRGDEVAHKGASYFNHPMLLICTKTCNSFVLRTGVVSNSVVRWCVSARVMTHQCAKIECVLAAASSLTPPPRIHGWFRFAPRISHRPLIFRTPLPLFNLNRTALSQRSRFGAPIQRPPISVSILLGVRTQG